MPKQAKSASPLPAFTPVATRTRQDGWTPEKQVRFVEALAESGCVTEACTAVAMSKQSAYALRMRPAAQQFRVAWDAALDLAIRRLGDECYSRALQGEAVPHFYKGEQVGEHRRFDNKLAMFLLRYRDPLRYAATLDQMVYSGHPEVAAIAYAKALNRVSDAGHGADPFAGGEADDAGRPPYAGTPVAAERVRQEEQELIASNRPIRGDWERRNRLQALRRAHREEARRGG